MGQSLFNRLISHGFQYISEVFLKIFTLVFCSTIEYAGFLYVEKGLSTD